jgi:hypothetical protein
VPETVTSVEVCNYDISQRDQSDLCEINAKAEQVESKLTRYGVSMEAE